MAWDDDPNPEVVGYRVYYGTASRNYSDVVDVGNVTTVTVSGLAGGVAYFFAITAYTANGLESDFSEELSYVFGLRSVQVNSVAGGRIMLTMTGPIGHTNRIEATVDLKTWTVIGTMVFGASGSVNFTDTNAASFQRRFYRTRDAQP